MTILEEAQNAVYGDRQADYGTVTENFGTIAKLWSAVLKTPITPEQVGLTGILTQTNLMAKSKTQLFKEGLLNKFDSKCFYCGSELTWETCITDHFIPKALGGVNRVSNYVPSCNKCNRMKGKNSIDELRNKILTVNPIFNFQFYFEYAGFNFKGEAE